MDAASDLVAVRAAEPDYEEHKTPAETAALLGTTRWQDRRPQAGARDAHATTVLAATYCLLPCVLKAAALAALQIFIIPSDTKAHTP